MAGLFINNRWWIIKCLYLYHKGIIQSNYIVSMFVGRSRQKLILIIGIRLEYISQKSENLGYDIL